jgi:nucleoside-diphosphate-sugar epimerase
MKRILITGSLGQLGSELVPELRKRYGPSRVVGTDLRPPKQGDPAASAGPFELLDCRDGRAMDNLIKKYRIDTLYHLAALLSATSEADPQKAWDINIGGLATVLETARENDCAVFTPSSIGAFGPSTSKIYTPQDTLQRPTTMYGVTKVTGELLCDYYYHKYGVDTRGVRYPGLISNVTLPGGGTTDYAVEIYYEAVKNRRYTCFLKGDTYLDMMYMPDAIRAAIDIMEADPARLRHRNAFNITAMSFCPEDQAAYIRKYIPEFELFYAVDPVRQAIANSWPTSREDYAARVEWGWKPLYDLDGMTEDMLRTLEARKKEGRLP